MRKIVITVVVLFFIILGYRIILKVKYKPPPSLTEIQKQQGQPVEAQEIRPCDISSYIVISGIVGSEEEALLSSKTGGRILKIYRDIGDIVRKEEKLVSIDTSQLEIEKIKAHNNIKIVQNQINQIKNKLDNAEKDLTRMRNLFKEGVIAQKQLENYKLSFDTIKEQHETSLLQLQVAKENLRIIETNIKDASVYAPFAGIIGERKAGVGEVIGSEKVILSIYNIKKLNGQVSVPGQYVPFLRLGQTAEITVDAFPERSITAKISKIGGASDPTTKLFKIHLVFESNPEFLKPGFFFKGKILTESKKNVLTVPVQALIQEGKEYFVFTVNDHTAEKKLVSPGLRNEGRVEIVSGLDSGDKVVIFGKEKISSGSRVKVILRQPL